MIAEPRKNSFAWYQARSKRQTKEIALLKQNDRDRQKRIDKMKMEMKDMKIESRRLKHFENVVKWAKGQA